MSSTPDTFAPSTRIAFVGGGNMARSLIGGLAARGAMPGNLSVADPHAPSRDALARDFGIRAATNSTDAVSGADCVMLAVKPQVMRTVCEALASTLPANAVVLSIAAGITTGQIDAWLGGGRRVVRAMPNTPALLGTGATGLYANARCEDADRALAASVMAAVGLNVWIADEAQMDTVTALSGSGPAYAFLLAEAMEAAATRLGLPAEAARLLTRQTLLGAARMLESAGEAPADLRARVTSPGGTTQAAIEAFEAGGFRELVDAAITAAHRRGAELARAAGG